MSGEDSTIMRRAQQILNITFGRESHIMNQCGGGVYFEFPKAILNCATATSPLLLKGMSHLQISMVLKGIT